MNDEPRMHMIISKTTQLFSIGRKTSLLVLTVTAILLAAPASAPAQKALAAPAQKAENGKNPGRITLADDVFEKAGEAYIKSLFGRGGRDKKMVKDQLSRADYNSKQKGRFALHESRKGLGMAYFRTNEGNYGKLLYTWGIGPKLHLKEIVVYDSRSGKTVVRTRKDIVLKKAGHMDLDYRAGLVDDRGLKKDEYRPDLHCSSRDGVTMYLRATDGASLLFPTKLVPMVNLY